MTDRSDQRGPREAAKEIDPGLAMRFPSVVRRVVSQHQQLEAFADQVRTATQAGTLRTARSAFVSFSDALGAHIDLEDQTVFPAIHGLNPPLTPQLSALVADHERFRALLDDLHDMLARGSAEEFARAFDSFLSDFASHEQREEQVVSQARRD